MKIIFKSTITNLDLFETIKIMKDVLDVWSSSSNRKCYITAFNQNTQVNIYTTRNVKEAEALHKAIFTAWANGDKCFDIDQFLKEYKKKE